MAVSQVAEASFEFERPASIGSPDLQASSWASFVSPAFYESVFVKRLSAVFSVHEFVSSFFSG